MTITIRRLLPADDRTAFASGDIDLDRFFVRYAGQNQFRHHVGITYVALDEPNLIVGYATITASEIATTFLSDRLQRRLPAYPVPVLRLARLAVDARAQGRGIGGELLRAVFGLARKMADDFGCAGVAVDAKPTAVSFYRTLGFAVLGTELGALGDRPEPIPMFLELGAFPR